MVEEKRCPGCGAILQTLDDQEQGYIPATLYNREDAICQRCFKLRHYGQFFTVPTVGKEYEKLLIAANKEQNLLVYVIDLFNFDGSIIGDLMDYVPHCPIFVVINKYDLLPKSLKEDKIKYWCSKKLNQLGIKYVDIVLISTRNKKNTDGLFQRIYNHANHKNIYVIGNANVGKSSLINILLEQYDNETNQYITSSIFPGTTISTIKIPLPGNIYLFDTPGMVSDSCLYRYLDHKNLKLVMNSREIKPLSITLASGQSLFIGSLVCIDYLEGAPSIFLFYGSNGLKTFRVKTENSAEKFDAAQLNPDYVPKANCYLSKASMDCYEFKLIDHERISIMISGLGWFDLLKGSQKIKVYVPKGIKVSLSEPMIGGNNLANK